MDQSVLSYLDGKSDLSHRLDIALKCFLAPLDYPTQQKEDVIMRWLADLLITTEKNKIFSEENKSTWRTMGDILTSRRFEALCQQQWICPLTSDFVESIVNMMKSQSDDDIKPEVIRVTYSIMNCSSLATLVKQNHNHILNLLSSLLSFTQLHLSQIDIQLTSLLLNEVNLYLQSKTDHKQVFFTIFENFFVLCVKLKLKLQNHNGEIETKLLKQLNTFMFSCLFQKEMFQFYTTMFSNILSLKSSNIKPSAEGENFCSVIVNCFTNEPLIVSEAIITDLFKCFIMKYKPHTNHHFQLIVIVCHMIGYSMPVGDNLDDQLEKDLSINLPVANLEKNQKEFLLRLVFGSIEKYCIETTLELNGVSVATWLNNLASLLLKDSLLSCEGYKALKILLVVSPSSLLTQMSLLMYQILFSKREEDDKELNISYDKLMCEIVKMYGKLQTIPVFLNKLIEGLTRGKVNLVGRHYLQDSMIYKSDLFPPRFMYAVGCEVRQLGHKQTLELWTTLIDLIAVRSMELIKSSDTGNYELASVIICLVSTCVSASSFLNVVTVVNMVPKVTHLMTRMANDGINKLLNKMLTLSHNNGLCGSLLLLCHSWGELHQQLCRTGTGYAEDSTFKVTVVNTTDPTDFTYLLPFIQSDIWALISARVANFGDKNTQLVMVRLVIQKLGHCSSFRSGSKVEVLGVMEGLSKFLITSLESWGSHVAELLAYHLSYCLQFMSHSHVNAVAQCLVNGYTAKEETWIRYLKSDHFMEADALHPFVLSSVCFSLDKVSSGGKRKSADDDLTDFHASCNNIFSKLSKNMHLLASPDQVRDVNSQLWKVINKCYGLFVKILNNDIEPTSFRNYNDLKDILDIISYLPLSHLDKAKQSVIILISWIILLSENSNNESSELLQLTLDNINRSLTSNCHYQFFDILNDFNIVEWIIKKRYKQSIVNDINYNIICDENLNYDSRSIIPTLPSVTDGYDELIRRLSTMLLISSSGEKLCDVTTLIIQHYDDGHIDNDAMCHVAVTLIYVCRKQLTKKNNHQAVHCRSVVQQITTWILQYFKKLEIKEINKCTTVAILYSFIALLDILNNDNKKEELNDSKHDKKSIKWQKKLTSAVELAKESVALKDSLMEKFVLKFLITTANCSEVLGSYRPLGLLAVAWNALSCPAEKSESSEIATKLKVSLGPLLKQSSYEEYEQLLKGLFEQLQDEKVPFGYRCFLWKVIIEGEVDGKHKLLKKASLEQLTATIVSYLVMKKQLNNNDILTALTTLKCILVNGKMMLAQTRALVFVTCLDIQLQSLPIEQYFNISEVIIQIANELIVRHKDVVSCRTPSILALIVHLVTTLIAQAGQDHKLSQKDAENVVNVSRSIDRVIKELSSFKIEVNKIIHFNVASIVQALQQTTVYPSVKVIIEGMIYHMLDLCDNYGLKHLLVSMPAATTTLLKHLQSNFSSYHRFNPIQA